ncbi:MAG: hypothetical protein AMJ94_11895, partial [Deltaproteobacteria bacterium SM23_61]
MVMAAMALILPAAGCAMMMDMQAREKTFGKAAPVITASFASPELSPGDTWKVYLKASDPDGDMESIVAVVDQTGLGSYPLSFTKLKEG